MIDKRYSRTYLHIGMDVTVQITDRGILPASIAELFHQKTGKIINCSYDIPGLTPPSWARCWRVRFDQPVPQPPEVIMGMKTTVAPILAAELRALDLEPCYPNVRERSELGDAGIYYVEALLEHANDPVKSRLERTDYTIYDIDLRTLGQIKYETELFLHRACAYQILERRPDDLRNLMNGFYLVRAGHDVDFGYEPHMNAHLLRTAQHFPWYSVDDIDGRLVQQ